MKKKAVINTDVLVIGAGGAGLAAALSAAELDMRVLVAEKGHLLGGTTALSIGSITACCTSYQVRAGIADTPEAFFEDVRKYNGDLDQFENVELLWLLAREAGKTIEWLRSYGLEFFGPSMEPPHRVPRMHNVLPNAWSYALILQRQAGKKGVRFSVSTPARHLITEGGRVLGALLENTNTGEVVEARASRGVILACGDYSGGDALKRRCYPPEIARVPAYNPLCEGEGHILAMEAGARTINMGIIKRPSVRFAPGRKRPWNELLPARPLFVKLYAAGSRLLPRSVFTRLANQILTTRGAPDDRVYKEGAILVNEDGARFTDELAKNAAVSIAGQPGNRAYIVFDSILAQKFTAWPYFISTAAGIAYAYLPDYERDVPDIVSKGATIEEAARKHPKGKALAETVRRYNDFAEAGVDRDYGRSPLVSISKPPFYVIGPAEAYLSVTRGGAAINESCQVLNESGDVIPGLLAAGRNGGGLIAMGHGTNLSWAFTSGRIAGKKAGSSEPA